MAASIEVTKFLDNLNHPLRPEIELLRHYILTAEEKLTENIKWNGPNYALGHEDRITMKIQPPKNIQLIFHRGAKVQAQPDQKLIQVGEPLLTWKGNDRAIATFTSLEEIKDQHDQLQLIVKNWLSATQK